MKKTNTMKNIIVMMLSLFVSYVQAQNTIETHFGDTVDCSGISIIQTFDNGFLITASKNPVSQWDDDLFIIKTDQLGDTLWTRTVPIETGIISKGIQTFDSGFVFTGRADSSLLLLKLNNSGDHLWEKEYFFGTNYSLGHSVIQSSDHNLYVVGENFIGTDVCCTPLFIKTDMFGNLLEEFDLSYVTYGRVYDIVETQDNYFVISQSNMIDGPPVPVLAKLNSQGTVQWYNNYTEYCECNVNLTHDNGFMISGLQVNTNKPYLIKTDAEGNVIWNKHSSYYHLFNHDLKVAQSSDDGFLMVGGENDTPGDLILLKVNSEGDSLWGRSYGGGDDDFGNAIISTNDNGYAIVGYTKSFGSEYKEVYFLKTDSLGLITSIKTYQAAETLITVSPNPFSNATNVRIDKEYQNVALQVLNASGDEVKGFDNIRGNAFTLNRENLPSGIYFLRLSQNNRVIATKKVIITDR